MRINQPQLGVLSLLIPRFVLDIYSKLNIEFLSKYGNVRFYSVRSYYILELILYLQFYNIFMDKMSTKMLVPLGLTLICFMSLAASSPIKPAKEVATEFIILHNNDMHSRFEQTSADSEKCTKEMEKDNKCYGGFARVAHL